MTFGGPSARPPGEGWQFSPEPEDDEAKRQLYAAHRRRRRMDTPSLVASVVVIAVFACLVVWFAVHMV